MSDCVADDRSNWSQLEVRVGSNYWSKGGITHNVSGEPQYDTPVVALQVSPNIAFGNQTSSVMVINEVALKKWTLAVSATWSTLETRKMHEKFQVEKWTPEDLQPIKNGQVGCTKY